MALINNVIINQLNPNKTKFIENRLNFSKCEKLLDSFEKYSQKLEKLLEETYTEPLSHKDFR